MRRLLALLILGLAAAFGAPAAAAELPVLELRAGADAPAVAPFVRYTTLAGETGAAQWRALVDGPLERVRGPTIHFGPPGIKTLVLLKLRNGGTGQGSWILTTGRGTLNHFRLFAATDDRLDLLVDADDPREVRQNLRTYQAFSTELVLDPGQEKLILIEFLSESSSYLPLKIQTYGSFFADRRANIAMVSAVVVGALTLLLLNFLFFSITGFREFLWLAVAEFFFAMSTVHAEGYITIFFLYDQPLAGIAVEDFIKCGFAGAMAQFGRSFVRTAVHFPRSDRALKALIAAAILLLLLLPGTALYPAELRAGLHLASWLVAVTVALFLPFVGYAAMKQLGVQLWPLFVGWASLGLFIVYAAIASMGVFAWLPVNWHLAGPIGLFEAVMVTLALGLNLRKIQRDKLAADANYARSLAEQLAISERAKRLAEEKAFALETVDSQNALLHASGHDSRQVIFLLNSAVAALRRDDRLQPDPALVDMLQSSADYLNEIVATTMSGANIAAGESDFVALGSFRGQALLEPLAMMFKRLFAAKQLTLDVRVEGEVTLVSDRPLLMRALANLLSNSCDHTSVGGARVTLRLDAGRAIIEIADSGSGMPPAVAAALNAGTAARVRGDASDQGTGSGFAAARRIVETLRGTLAVVASDASGTTVRLVLPAAAAGIEPIAADELAAGLPGWTLLDFDQRAAFDAVLAAPGATRERLIALTYDDTSATRGRLSELVAMAIIKPACRELLEHPLLAERRRDQAGT